MMTRIAIAPGHASSMTDVLRRLDHYLGQPDQRRHLLTLAQEADFDLERALDVCSRGPIPGNRFAQPLQFLLGYAAWKIGEHDYVVDGVAGHSLGEFLAVAIVGSVSWTDSLRLVLRCGTVMDAVHRIRPGAMSALLGFDEQDTSKLCDIAVAAVPGVLEIANLNLTDQIVVSGDRRCVEELERRVQTTEGRRVIRLDIAGAAHSSIYAGHDPMHAVLKDVSIMSPRIPLYLSTKWRRISGSDDVRQALARILVNRVDWVQTLQAVEAEHPGFSPALIFPDRGMASILKRAGHPNRTT